MGRKDPETEATLGEVLAEVSLADLSPMLKRGLAAMGCWAVFYLVIFLFTTVTDSAGVGFDSFGVPDWIVWLLFAWMMTHAATSHRSFHELSWYFPKLNWLGSLLLAGYLLGFFYLAMAVSHMEVGAARLLAAFAVFVGYMTPFAAFLAVTHAGYDKLMEKRRTTAREPAESSAGLEW
jgi:hypothetical protein